MVGHSQGLAFAFGHGLLDVHQSAVDDFALGSVDYDQFPFFLIVLVFDDSVNIPIFGFQQVSIEFEDGDFGR